VYSPYRHPDGQTIGLEAGNGQEGVDLTWVWADGARIGLRKGRAGWDRLLMAIHPDGQEYLTAPHPTARAKALVRHRLGDDRPLEQLTAVDAFGDRDGRWAAEPGGYVTGDLIIAAGRGGHLLLQHTPLRLLGVIAYPDAEGRAVVGARDGSWLTLTYVRDGLGRLQRWRLATPPAQPAGDAPS
jgi:YD repeat-containing protein